MYNCGVGETVFLVPVCVISIFMLWKKRQEVCHHWNIRLNHLTSFDIFCLLFVHCGWTGSSKTSCCLMWSPVGSMSGQFLQLFHFSNLCVRLSLPLIACGSTTHKCIHFVPIKGKLCCVCQIAWRFTVTDRTIQDETSLNVPKQNSHRPVWPFEIYSMVLKTHFA